MSDSTAKQLWQEKLAFLQAEEPRAVDPEQKFKLKKDIAEARARLAELERGSTGQAPGAALSRLKDVVAAPVGQPDQLTSLAQLRRDEVVSLLDPSQGLNSIFILSSVCLY